MKDYIRRNDMEPIILLDNGHGKDTYGKSSPVWSDGSQLLEYEFNRDLVKRIHGKLDLLQIANKILIPEVIDIRLNVRCDRANEIYRQNSKAFLISVHGNAGGGKGWEIYTSPGETKSDEIATEFFNVAKKYLSGFRMRADHSDGDPDKESKFYILVNTNCPAILTENLFFDNEDECKFMLSDIGREVIADMHVKAIVNFLKS